MTDTSVVSLGWHIGREGAVLLQQAEQWDYGSPFVVIKYELWGRAQELGLRLDLDKQVFLDSLDDPDLNESLFSAAQEVCELVAAKMRH